MANVQEKVSNVQEQVERAMERMGEAAQSVGQKVSDFFQGNPFDTSVGRKIELATDANKLATENWGLNMEICDFINSTNEGPRDAIRAIKKRLQTQMGKNNAIVMFTLTVLETCVKNCDIRFTTLVCQKEFLGELIKLISAKHDAPQIVQERILILIQSWADAFRGNSALSGVVEMYDELKAKGVEFPATNLDSLAPIITPKQTVFPLTEQKLATEITDNIQSLQHNIPISTTKIQQQQPFQIQNPIGPMQLSPDQMAKLRSELDIVQINITVLRDLITQIKPTNNGEKLQPTEDFHFLQELHAASIEMQKRITDLIPVITNEEVTYELLSINDELNSTFEKYDRCMAKFNSQGVDITMIPSGSGSKTTNGASQPQSSDLIDFASETYPKVKNSSLESTKELNQQLGGIDLDNSVTEMNQQPILAKDNEARNECYIHDQAQVGIHTVCNNRSESIGLTETDKEKSEKKNIEPKKADDDGL